MWNHLKGIVETNMYSIYVMVQMYCFEITFEYWIFIENFSPCSRFFFTRNRIHISFLDMNKFLDENYRVRQIIYFCHFSDQMFCFNKKRLDMNILTQIKLELLLLFYILQSLCLGSSIMSKTYTKYPKWPKIVACNWAVLCTSID